MRGLALRDWEAAAGERSWGSNFFERSDTWAAKTARGECMRNIALKLMYNGTAYHGWQVQKNAVTVCGTREKAIAAICGGPVHLTGCGRTDAGVHAEHYIANFRTESRIPLDRLPFAINTHTPEEHRREGGLRGGGGLQRHRLVHQEGVHLPDLQLPVQEPLLRKPGLLLPQASWTRIFWTGRRGCSWAPTILRRCGALGRRRSPPSAPSITAMSPGTETSWS